MRIRIGLVGAAEAESPQHGGGLMSLLSRHLTAMLIRTDTQVTYVSPAHIRTRLVGTLHTDWITVPAEHTRLCTDFRGKRVRVEMSGTSGAGPVDVRLHVTAGGTPAVSLSAQVPAQGSLRGRLEAHADSFLRVDVSPEGPGGGQNRGGLYSHMSDLLRRISI